MLRQLNRIGILDDGRGRRIVEEALRQSYSSGRVVSERLPGMANGLGSVERLSMLQGPKGDLIMHSFWQGNRLITVILKTPRTGGRL